MLDQITINKFIAGDVKAFERLFRKYARSMQLVALGLYRDTAVAEDAVQESFVYLWNHRKAMKPDIAIEGYLYSCVRHYVLNYIRHQNIRIRQEKEIVREQEWLEGLTYDEIDVDAKLLIIKKVIDALPEGCRKIFVMSVIEGMSYTDTAKELGVSVNTVKSQVKIAYKKLKNTVQKSPDNMYLTILFLLSLKKYYNFSPFRDVHVLYKRISKYRSMDTSTKEELFRKVWAALYEEGNKDELQVREVVDQMYMAVKEPELDIEEVFDKVQREIGTVRNKERRLWWNVIKYAVAVVLPLGLGVAGYILWNGGGNEQRQQMEGYVRPQNAVMLTLAFGKKIAVDEQQLEESLTTDAVTIRRDSIEGLVYEVSGQKNRAAERFNILEVPVAAEYQLRLSDGTVVYLNSDSRLKYPEVFTGNERKVYLEGEAYFEVAKDKEHPFKVMAQGVEVNVLGTHFNVNAYPERTDVVITLVEGKVRVERGTRQIVLVPGEQAAASAESLNVKKVEVREYIAWKDGLFVFSRMSLEEIMRQVYRWYGVETVFSDETVKAVTFTGIIDKSMPLGELFKV